MHKILGAVLVAVALAVTGCGSEPVQSSKSKRPQQGEEYTEAEEASSAGAGDAGEGTEVPGPQEGVLSQRIVYFDYDSSEILGEGTNIVTAHAQYLADHPNLRVRLEGHTDERGSREYNIGLGERRSQAVRRALMLQGVSDSQVSTVSYGEERPAAAGSDDAAWAKNRRVELVYLQ